MEEILIATFIRSGGSCREALLLAESIRSFTGKLANCPLQVYCPEALDTVDEQDRTGLQELGVEWIHFPLEEETLRFPFAAKTCASGGAEAHADGQARVLVWVDSGSLFFQEPGVLALEEGVALGYRPVDHTLIGSHYEEVITPFWAEVYEACRVPSRRVFPMQTSQDGNILRPYFNAGMLAVRPEHGILRAWGEKFMNLYREAFFEGYYQKDQVYAIFVHQVVLSAVILAVCSREELIELPHLVNYPLHMHREYPPEKRPARINDLVSCRYEQVFQDSDWRRWLPVDEPLKSWLEARFSPA
jgi:hypothetical protein